MAVAAAVIGAGASVIGGIQSSRAQKAAAEENARIARRNARIARDQTVAEVVDRRRANRRTYASIINTYGSQGLAMNGSAMDVLQDTVGEGELDVQRVIYHGALRSLGYMDAASTFQREAKSIGAAMPFQVIGGLANVAGAYYNAIPATSPGTSLIAPPG